MKSFCSSIFSKILNFKSEGRSKFERTNFPFLLFLFFYILFFLYFYFFNCFNRTTRKIGRTLSFITVEYVYYSVRGDTLCTPSVTPRSSENRLTFTERETGFRSGNSYIIHQSVRSRVATPHLD